MGRKSNVTAPTLTIVDSANSHDASPSTTPMRPTPLIGSWGDYEWGMDMKTAVLQTTTQSGEKKLEQDAFDATPDHMVLARQPTQEHIELCTPESSSAPTMAASPVEPVPQQATPAVAAAEQEMTPLTATFGQESMNSHYSATPETITPQTQSYNEHYYPAVQQRTQHQQSPPSAHVHQPYGASPRYHQPQHQQAPQQQQQPHHLRQPMRSYVPQQRQVLEGSPAEHGFDAHSHHQRVTVPAPQQYNNNHHQQQQRSYHPIVNVQRRTHQEPQPVAQRNMNRFGAPQQQQQQQQQQQYNQMNNKPRGPVQVSKFAPPAPPTARCDAIFMRDGSPDDAFYNIVMRWYERAVLAQEAHPAVDKCPPAEEYLHDFPGWLKEVEKWWNANFANRKGRPQLRK